MAPYIQYSVLCWLSTSIMYGLMIEFHTSPLEATLCYLGFITHLYSLYTLDRVHVILQVKTHVPFFVFSMTVFMLKYNLISFILLRNLRFVQKYNTLFWLFQENKQFLKVTGLTNQPNLFYFVSERIYFNKLSLFTVNSIKHLWMDRVHDLNLVKTYGKLYTHQNNTFDQ